MILNPQEFIDKKIIVTGSSTGIGMLTAIEYLRLGAKVIFHGNNSLNISVWLPLMVRPYLISDVPSGHVNLKESIMFTPPNPK